MREIEPGHYAVDAVPTPLLLARLTGWLSERDILLTELRVGGHSLEEVYLRLTGGGAERSGA